jgi:cytochrome c
LVCKNKDAGLYRIEYNRGNRAPVAHLTANNTAGGLPLEVQFSSEGSFDHDSSKLSYKWYFDKDEVQSKEAKSTLYIQRAGVYNVRLVVSDKEGKSSEKTIRIKAGNAEPEISLETDGNKSFYWANNPIRYKLNVTDKEDGSLAGRNDPGGECAGLHLLTTPWAVILPWWRRPMKQRPAIPVLH